MEQKNINGFSQKEIYTLYSFLNIYEHERIKYMNQAELFEKYPHISEIIKVMESFRYEEKTKDKLKEIDINSITNEFYFTKHKSKTLGVLYHLRNSIAHAKIRKVKSDVYIEDFDTKIENPEHTAKGKISFKAIEDIQKIIQNNNLKTTNNETV